MDKKDKHIYAIKQIYKNAESISGVNIAGYIHDVYIVKDSGQKYICRFSDKITAQYDLHISKLLLSNNICVPNISVHKFQDLYFETYNFISGKTFHERIIEGISDESKDRIYKQLFNLSVKISKIPYRPIKSPNESVWLKCLRSLFHTINAHEKRTLCHFDLHTKNVILDNNDNVMALIDLDSINLYKPTFAFVSMMAHAKRHGYQSNELIKEYEKTIKKKPIISVQSQVNIYYYILCFYIDFLRKHMLNLMTR